MKTLVIIAVILNFASLRGGIQPIYEASIKLPTRLLTKIHKEVVKMSNLKFNEKTDTMDWTGNHDGAHE